MATESNRQLLNTKNCRALFRVRKSTGEIFLERPVSARDVYCSAMAKTTLQPVARPRKTRQSARTSSIRTVFRGKVFTVTSDEVVEPSGVNVRRDTIHHSGSVVVLAVDESLAEPRVLLVRQYRYAAKQYLWELPAGRIDPGEDALEAAKRELIEETGYSAAAWQKALWFYSSPGFLDETMKVFVARSLKRGKARPEEDEFITKRLFPLRSAVQLVMRGNIHDGKTIAAVLWLAMTQKSQKKRK